MDDLINRQMLMKEFTDFVKASNNSDFARVPTWNDAVSLVGSAPLVPLLTCKECEHWETGWSCGGALHYCPMVDGIHGPNFFCGYAEPCKDEYVAVLKKEGD